jgi:hypothetical protein
MSSSITLGGAAGDALGLLLAAAISPGVVGGDSVADLPFEKPWPTRDSIGDRVASYRFRACYLRYPSRKIERAARH